MLCSAGSGVKMVHVVLLGLSCSSFSLVHLAILFRYGCTVCLAVFLLVCVAVIVVSSA